MSQLRELYTELKDFLENGLDDLQEHFDNVETETIGGELSPKMERDADNTVLESMTEDNQTEFEEIQKLLHDLSRTLKRLGDGIAGEL